jgi:DNA-binding transcriptional MocR family regulator
VDLDAWIRHAKECGLLLKPPSHFYLSEPSSCTRMGFSQVDEAGLTEAVQRLKQALVKIGRR